ncbi:MAG: thiamine diphosphokinase [Lachnospiraceae bacterium]|nr:thiamine diphosphokinase [Lachnospiraceae bacterium]
MVTIIITGGTLNEEFACQFLKEHPWDALIAADRGLKFCYEQKIQPDYIIGDYDSIEREIVTYYREQSHAEVETYHAEKDATDTQIALEKALYLESDTIYILGALGGRMDHGLANIQLLNLALEEGAEAYLADEHNMIRLIDRPETIRKEKQMGKYVSFLPFTDRVDGVTLQGFKYPLNDYTMVKGSSIGVSNEIEQEEASVTFDSGVLLMIQSRD